MHIVIVGNGIAGSTAARYLRKHSDHKITMISEETALPYARTALMYIFMGHVRYEDTLLYSESFWRKNRIVLKKAKVTRLDIEHQHVHCSDKSVLKYDRLILALGSQYRLPAWPGVDLQGVSGLYHIQDMERLEGFIRRGINRAVVIGGGLIGIELVEMLHSRGIPVSFLVRESSFWNRVLPAEESAMVNQHILAHGIDLKLSTEAVAIEGTGQYVKQVRTATGETIPCDFVGVTIGVSPNTSLLEGTPIEIGSGILVNEKLETNIPNVYAIGDCAEIRQPITGRKAIEAVWYTGRLMGATVAYVIANHPVRYDPGIWFNSAKFFGLEYQLYGEISTDPSTDVKSIYISNPENTKSIRINYDHKERRVLGFNLMGIRFRHEICDRWISQRTDIHTVLAQIKEAYFDPELFSSLPISNDLIA